MPHYGILHDHKLEGVDDLRGAEVYGLDDEKLGSIDDVIFEHSTGDIRYVVLKTGGLFSHKRVMVPAARIEPYGDQDGRFYIDLDKGLLKEMPEFKEEALANAGGWSAFELENERFWTENPLVNSKLTGRMITPPHEEEEIGLNFAIGSTGPVASGTKSGLKLERMGHQDDLLGVGSGVNKTTLRPKRPSIGGKEDVEMIERGKREAERREVMSPVGSEIEIPREAPPASHEEAFTKGSMREPGVYKLDPVVESEQGAGPSERQTVDLGLRWNAFQQGLRARRKSLVVECPSCASQEKAA